jgi:HopA1 effector protein family
VSAYEEQVAGALAAVEVISPTSFSWFGVPSPGLAGDAVAMMGAASARAYLLYNLQTKLYADFYCAGTARPPLDSPVVEPMLGGSPFVQVLSQANAGTGAREPGWTIVREDNGQLVVQRAGLALWVSPGDVYAAGQEDVAPGATVSVLMPKELLRLSPGFYMALGDAELALDGSSPLVRFYWNLRSDAAAPLLAALTARFNDEGLPFRLKVVNDPARYSRCDAGVLYTRRADYERVRDAVLEVYPRLASGLKPAIPALTKELAPGLGFAEDPGVELTSFGMSRCMILADAIIRAAERGLDGPRERLDVVRERFAEDGIALERPYLNGASTDSYVFAVS